MSYISEQADGIIVRFHVQPKASKSEITGIHGDRLKVRLKAPPVDGKANEELVRFLSKFTGLPRANIEIISGNISRQKNVKLTGISKETFLFQFQKR